MKIVELLIDDICGRFKKGEIGVLLENDFSEKYEYKVLLVGSSIVNIFGKEIAMRREFYFYKDEVRHLN